MVKQRENSEQKDALLELCKHFSHHKITPEVRRELINAKCRESTYVKVIKKMNI